MAFKRDLTRKQQRKEKRKQKKIKRNEYYGKRKTTDKLNPSSSDSKSCPALAIVKGDKKKNITKLDQQINNKVLTTEQLRKKEQKEQKQIEKEMVKQRNKQLLESNINEDRIIKQLEKKLGINKRKSKCLPKGFSEDGLDYLLELCDPEAMKNIVAAETGMETINNQFEEDFILMTDNSSTMKSKKNIENVSNAIESEDVEESEENESDGEHENNIFEDLDNEQNSDSSYSSLKEQLEVKHKEETKSLIKQCNSNKRKLDESDEDSTIDENSDYENSCDDSSNSENDSNNVNEGYSDSDTNANEVNKGCVKKCPDGTWEDIYGRMRGVDGSVITKTNNSKYIPPALRQKFSNSDDKKRLEKLFRLKKQLKGLLNKLAESNMHNIVNQIENLYMNNTRNDMNDSLTSLIIESVVSEVITPERLLIEHIVLLTVLHANVGSEVGAHFLQQVANSFDNYISSDHKVENKLLDNIVIIIAQLYNFKIIDSKLIYEVLKKLSNIFNEKCVECILHILRNVGFSLRKDDPLALKSIILELQKQASNVSEADRDNSRVKFMLDILLAIKNNNIKKIPNYDASYSEHMKKIMKGFIRKGNYVMQLNISLDDLQKADQRGRWWVVGSAWSGNKIEETSQTITHSEEFSQNLLDLAKSQRMNTDTRKNLFCIIMSAEDYLDAFEKILRLSLKNQQERDIINVIIHCCLQEKNYNPYYAYLAQKFCDYDRKFQMMIKYTVWDKLKSLQEQSGNQISNLAKLLIHLFIEKGLTISILKIVQFSELDNVTLRFMRQILIGILLHEDEDASIGVFSKISKVEKLKMFCESLRLFIYHFLLRNLKSEVIAEDQKLLLENRAKMVEKILATKQFRM